MFCIAIKQLVLNDCFVLCFINRYVHKAEGNVNKIAYLCNTRDLIRSASRFLMVSASRKKRKCYWSATRAQETCHRTNASAAAAPAGNAPPIHAYTAHYGRVHSKNLYAITQEHYLH